MGKKHSFAVRKRAFLIWQHLGFIPWKKPKEKKRGDKQDTSDFYKGAFDSIPFLNDDAKRTFQHLLLRPGHMIRDYIGGQHERYLAPLTALIVFYAFFALVSAVLEPVQQRGEDLNRIRLEYEPDSTLSAADAAAAENYTRNVVQIVRKGYIYLHLDQYPEEVDTQHEAAIAALEGTLRSQGIPLFISEFLFLWLAMMMSLRRFRLRRSACAAAAAYVLCQFSFFMLFAVLFTLGKSKSISIVLMLFLLMLDYRQWLGITWKKSFWRALNTGLCYGIIYVGLILLISALVLGAALLKG